MCWVVYALTLLLMPWFVPTTRLWMFKFAVAVGGLASLYLSFTARVRWQPWVFASAAAYLALHGLLAASVWFSEGVTTQAVRSLITGRVQLFYLQLSSGMVLSASSYAVEAVLMPVVQLLSAALALVRWRARATGNVRCRNIEDRAHVDPR